MTVTRVDKDPESRTMTITAEFDAPVDRVWLLWADPRRLERWWGPPAHPATVTEHDLRPGGKVSYFVDDPAGDRLNGSWQVIAVDPPRHLEFDQANPQLLPTVRMRVALEPRADGGTRMTIDASFPTGSAMDELLRLGFDQGMSTAVGQMDAALSG
jgi:uncharacterized protein YndB with AHSA1/START domain